MFAPPTPQEIIAVAQRFGVHLGEDDARHYERLVVDSLDALNTFLQARMEEHRPPLLFPERGPGYRPSAEEDPFDAWLWKCAIGGSGEGLLAGRTVSFKDHIAVAGIPLTFGAHGLEGFIPDIDATVVNRVLAAGGKVMGKNTHHGLSGLRSLGGGLGDYWCWTGPVTGCSRSGRPR